MNIAVILAAGVGQRMRNGGLPKQFLKLMGKPIVIYTLEKFEESVEIDKVIVVCHRSYVEYMQGLIQLHQINKVSRIVIGGSDRQESLWRGLEAVIEDGGAKEDIIVVHDGVRPMVSLTTIRENIRVAEKYGCAITVHPVTESVVVTGLEEASMSDFKKRAETYFMTAPQTFQLGRLVDAYHKAETGEEQSIPLL